MQERKNLYKFAPLFIFILALCLRIILAYDAKVALLADDRVYHELAVLIKNQGIFSLTMLNNIPLKDHPVYPLFLGAIYSLFGINHFAVFVIQAFIGSLLCILVYLIANEFFNSKVAILSGIIAACYPLFMKLSSMLLTENLFVFLFLLSIWLMAKYTKTLRLYYLILAALCLGLSVLTRSVILLFIFLLLPYLFLLQKKKMRIKRNILNSFIFITVFICSIAPWTIRNYYISEGNIIPVTEATDRGLYISFRPYKEKIFGVSPDNDPVMVEAKGLSSFEERRKFFLSKTIDFIKNNPAKVAKIELLKIAYLWSPFSWEILGNGQARYNFGFVFIMPFFIYGTVLLVRQKEPQYLILFLPIVYFQLIHIVYFAVPRFRIGFEPFLIVIAAYAIYSTYSKVNQKSLYILALLMFLTFNVFLFLNSSRIKVVLREIFQMIGLW